MKKILNIYGLLAFTIWPACFAFAQNGPNKKIADFQFEISRLSPVPQMVSNTAAAKLALDGEWEFSVKGKNTKKPIVVPGEWEMQGFKVYEGETAIYSKRLDIPADWKGKRIKIRFDGVSSHALVKVNGIAVAEHEGSFVPFEADITKALTNTNNILQVEVQAQTISDILACTSQYAVHTVGGILRNVRLFALPPLNISNENITTTFDDKYKNAVLGISYSLANESSPGSNKVQLKFLLLDKNGMHVKEQSTAGIVPQLSKVTNGNITINVTDPIQWNPEHPYLYTLITELYNDGKLMQTNRQHIGFRQVQVTGSKLLVNGKPVKLHGVNRHSVSPLTGRAITAELEVKDAQLFRDCNCNYIRTSHYPPSEAFLNACDSLGLFVESESSLCWIGHGAAPIWKKWDYKDPQYLPYMVQANVEKVNAQRNHPSVIIWSLGNESVWSSLWARVNEIVKKTDPSRPTTFHDQCWGGFNNAHSTADIAVYHYPGINGPAACDTMNRPVLFGEYAHVSCYSRRELLTDPGVREAYGAPLKQMYDSIYHHPACLGGAIWSGIDDTFHMPDGRIVGYGPWGPVDGWRRPKPEYYGMKKAYEPVVITNVSHPVVEQGRLKLLVENRYDFTKLEGAAITCKVDGADQKISANILPHGKGVIYVSANKDTKVVNITITDPRGFIANEEQIVLKAEPIKNKNKVTVTESENEAVITVKQDDVTYLISKMTGLIISAEKNGVEILKQGPVFGIVPMSDDDGGKPNVAGETYQNNIYPIKNYPLYTLPGNKVSITQQNDGVKLLTDVTFIDGKGTQTCYFSADGTVSITYEVEYAGKDTLPRQYGLILQLPKRFDKLSWKRKGDFSIYPDNDIGRNEGSAMLNSKHVAEVEEWRAIPKNDWKDDANDLGSNDFRSTKRYIYNASLTDDTNNSIQIISDGSQSVRSWLQDGAIQLLVADYCNNGSEPFYGSPFTNGIIKTTNKKLTGKLTFVIQ